LLQGVPPQPESRFPETRPPFFIQATRRSRGKRTPGKPSVSVT
jgi:hypothetical protein